MRQKYNTIGFILQFLGYMTWQMQRSISAMNIGRLFEHKKKQAFEI